MSTAPRQYGAQKPRLGMGTAFKLIWPYVLSRVLEQLRSVWFIALYLTFFQVVVLGLPIVFPLMIVAGFAVVLVGLALFMEGLRLGLMPLGETMGAVLPRNSKLPFILFVGFLLGVMATFAEPAIGILRTAGAGVAYEDARLLFVMLNRYTSALVVAVGLGVGLAVSLGVLRFFFGWSLKSLLFPCVGVVLALTAYAQSHPDLRQIIGLAWDCGGVTTGPVTVPLVLALGIGVARIVGTEDMRGAGFGIVTLASLFPIAAVLGLGIALVSQGAHLSPLDPASSPAGPSRPVVASDPGRDSAQFTEEEFEEFVRTGQVPADYEVRYRGGEPTIENGRITLSGAELVFEKVPRQDYADVDIPGWDPAADVREKLVNAMRLAAQAIVPLTALLYLVLRLVLRERLRNMDEITLGIGFALAGLGLFSLGILLGLTPLGSQLGTNIPASFATVQPWALPGAVGPLFEQPIIGMLVVGAFGLLLGYGATLAEPALNALGETVEEVTVGAFKKSLLMQAVAVGVGLGIGAGAMKIVFDLPLAWMLIPPYLFLLLITAISDDEFVNFAWDSAGVTTGPITVPLVLAMGLGLSQSLPDVIDGFGVLALASLGPILTVLLVGLVVRRNRLAQTRDADQDVREAVGRA